MPDAPASSVTALAAPFASHVFVTHLGATLFMVGLIWCIQVVHYPLFAQVGTDLFPTYERLHTLRITWIVAPVMLVELATGVLLLLAPPPWLPRWAAGVGAALLAVAWLSTALLQIPRHGQLATGFEPAAHAALVASNWIRTAAWSARGLLLLAYTGRGLAEKL